MKGKEMKMGTLDELPIVLTPAEVCDVLRIETRRPDRTVANLARRWGLRVVHVGRAPVVERSDLAAFLSKNRT